MAETLTIRTASSTEVVKIAVPGPQGPAGQGVPVGGTTGQVLRKASGTNYDTEWATGGGGASYDQSLNTTDSVTFESVTADKVAFDLTAAETAAQGELAWNADEETLDLGLAHGSVLQVGQETLYHVENSTASAITAGTLCVFSGTVGNSGKLRVAPHANNTNPTAILGVATSTIAAGVGEEGYITHFGKCRGINASGGAEAWANGDLLYASPTGGLTKTKPAAPIVTVAAVVSNNSSSGTLFVRPSFGQTAADVGLGNVANTAQVTSVTGTAPIVSSGGTTPAISISEATTSAAGSMSSADKAKLDAGSFTTLSASNDMEITDNSKGVILKSPNNTRYRLTVSNSGLPIFTALLLLLLAQLAPAQNVGMATDTNGTILTDRTNTLTFTNPLTWATNVVAATRTNLGLGSLATNNSVPSGAATTNSLLTADGAGGSAFVVSRTVTKFTTNDQTKTNWGFNAGTQAANNDPQMGSIALDANSFYLVEYAVAWVATTNSGFNHGLGFSTNLAEFNIRSGIGQAANTTMTSITAGTNQSNLSFPSGSAVGTGGRFAVAGFVYVLTSSNANTMTYRWYPVNNSADATTLIRSSMISVTKMAP